MILLLVRRVFTWFLNCTINDKPVTLVSVYFPPGLTVALFNRLLHKIQDKITSYDNPDVLWFGDFNAILAKNLDANKVRVTPYSQPLQDFIDGNELSDVWRGFHPFERRYTCFTKGRSALSRIDLFLASPTFLTRIVKSDIYPAYCSDHSAISVDFSFSDNTVGRGFFRLPNFLLQDASFGRVIRTVIRDTQFDNLEADPALLWDLVKAKIRGATIKFLSEWKQHKKTRIEALENEIAQASQERDQSSSLIWFNIMLLRLVFCRLNWMMFFLLLTVGIEHFVLLGNIMSLEDQLSIIFICQHIIIRILRG